MKIYTFFVRTCNNLLGWSDRNFDSWKIWFEHKSTEFVTRKWLRTCRWSKFNFSDSDQRGMLYLWIYWKITCAYRQISCSSLRSLSKSIIIELVNILVACNSVAIRCTKFVSHLDICKYIGAICKCSVKWKKYCVFMDFIWTSKWQRSKGKRSTKTRYRNRYHVW